MVSPLTVGAAHENPWQRRRWALMLLGGVIGLAVHHIMKTGDEWRWTEDTGRVALATFLGVAGVCFGFVIERGKIIGSAAFAFVAALVVASVLYWSGDFRSWEPWRLVSALLTVAIAAPLFQAWRDGGERRWHIPYVAAHDRAWTNVCLWFACWAFVGIAFVLAWLLAALFDLIGIDLLEELLRKSWFCAMLAGAAFGGAVGLLRDRERIVSMLQRIVMMVLSVLAPVLAVGLVLFLAALPFTGLGALWETTKATTPILLSCVIGALILANAVIGDQPEDEAKQRIMRWSAMALGATLLPLGVIAAISTGLRVQQYGLTPTRLWAVTFTAIACAYGLAYLVSIARERERGWSDLVRHANMRLAVALCCIALLLSTPLISFGAMSARDQIARLNDGRVTVEKFDFAALRFDFGPAGIEALRKLKTGGHSREIREAATEAMTAENSHEARSAQQRAEAARQIVVHPKGAELSSGLRERLTEWDACGTAAPCHVILHPEEVLILHPGTVAVLTLKQGKWTSSRQATTAPVPMDDQAIARAFSEGSVEIRDVKRRQVHIDGKPVGEAFE